MTYEPTNGCEHKAITTNHHTHIKTCHFCREILDRPANLYDIKLLLSRIESVERELTEQRRISSSFSGLG